MRGRVVRAKRIVRSEVRARRGDAVFVFGDNLARAGLGGQAAEMRGEPNAVGVPTKWRPGRDERSYFGDDDWRYDGVRIAIESAFYALRMYLDAGYDVVLPAAGLGTGLADLPRRAPAIYEFVERRVLELEAYAEEGGP